MADDGPPASSINVVYVMLLDVTMPPERSGRRLSSRWQPPKPDDPYRDGDGLQARWHIP